MEIRPEFENIRTLSPSNILLIWTGFLSLYFDIKKITENQISSVVKKHF